jgi:hypothetical protein
MIMLKYWSAGWKMTLWNPFLIVFFFLYQLLWGFILYRFIQSIVVPILHRYPGEGMPQELNFIFSAESQFQLMKTDLASAYLWTLAAFLLTRMIVTPLLNAGIYDSIQQTHLDKRRSFLRGVRRWALPFVLLYLLQTALALAPLYWVIPYVEPMLLPVLSGQLDSRLLIALCVFYLYLACLKLAFMYLQFGVITGSGWLLSLKLLFSRFLKIAALSASILVMYGLVAAVGITVSMVYAGLVAVLLHQLYHLVKAMFRLWEIGAQHHYYLSKTN